MSSIFKSSSKSVYSNLIVTLKTNQVRVGARRPKVQPSEL